MRNTLRTYVVSSLIAVMTINPAWACHGCGGWGGGYGSPVYYGSSYNGGGCCGGWSGCCGGYEVVYESDSCQSCGGCSSCGTVMPEGSTGQSSHPSSQLAPKTESQPSTAAPPAAEPQMPNPPQQPAKVDRPIDNTPAPSLPSASVPAQPPVPLPNSESTPAAPSSNDLFNSTPTPPAATKPAEKQAEKPAETPAATPAVPPQAEKPASDDLFGAPAAEKPAAAPEKPAEKPAATPPAPESKPAASDDLFGAPAAEKAAPAEKPAAPAEKPAEKPAGEEKKDEKKSDDIFGSSSSVLHEAGGLASNEMRQWVDNTGNFACQARLVRLVDGQVQLLKDNGHTTTVQLSRLSANDLRFVERQASAQHVPAFQTAQSTSEMPWMAN